LLPELQGIDGTQQLLYVVCVHGVYWAKTQTA